jgi:hypothetical protein
MCGKPLEDGETEAAVEVGRCRSIVHASCLEEAVITRLKGLPGHGK